MDNRAAARVLAFSLVCAALPASAQSSFQATYRETANLFHLLDCVSDWNRSHCHDDGAYRRDWEGRVGSKPDDAELFDGYSRIRQKYFRLESNQGLFLSTSILEYDPLANSFYASDTLEGAMVRLQSLLAADELEFLRRFYAHFHERAQVYLADSAPFVQAATASNQTLQNPDYDSFFRDAARFYGVQSAPRFTSLLVWWPLPNRNNAIPSGEHLILRKNPGALSGSSDADIFFHETVHTLSARQTPGQKDALTAAFRSRCSEHAQPNDTYLLEEPLAVAIGQMLILKRSDPSRFTRENDWYQNAWVNRFAPAIFPEIEEAFSIGQNLDVALAQKLGDICAGLATR